MLPADVPPIPAGIRIAHVRFDLDEDTHFQAELCVQHVSGGMLAPAGGTRLGCSFQHLDGAAQRALQRCIDLTQRRTKFLTLS
jgi:hypothetical protein